MHSTKSTPINAIGSLFKVAKRNSPRSAAIALGAFALGASAMGAIAVGFMAINRLAIKKAKVETLEIGELVVEKISRTSKRT